MIELWANTASAKRASLSGVLDSGLALDAGAHIDDFGPNQSQGFGDRLRRQPSGQDHRVPGQPASSLPGYCEIERDARPARRVKNPGLDQHGLGFGDRVPQCIQIGRHRDSHDPPDLEVRRPEAAPLPMGDRIHAAEHR